MATTTLNIRIDDTVKANACAVLNSLNLNQSDAVRMLFEYIALHKKMPIKLAVVDDDSDLIALTKQRLANPEPSFEVDLDTLWLTPLFIKFILPKLP